MMFLPLLRQSRSALALRRFCATTPFLVKKDGKSPTVNLTTNASTCIDNKVASNGHHHSTCSFSKGECVDKEKVTLCTFRRLNLTTFNESTTTTNSNMSYETSLNVSETCHCIFMQLLALHCFGDPRSLKPSPPRVSLVGVALVFFCTFFLGLYRSWPRLDWEPRSLVASGVASLLANIRNVRSWQHF